MKLEWVNNIKNVKKIIHPQLKKQNQTLKELYFTILTEEGDLELGMAIILTQMK